MSRIKRWLIVIVLPPRKGELKARDNGLGQQRLMSRFLPQKILIDIIIIIVIRAVFKWLWENQKKI